ncbi:MAG: DUF6033 family protein [Syntrophomonadaceae bacterium]|jgi:hypothetical protein
MLLSSVNRSIPYYLQLNNISRNNHADNFNTSFKDTLSKATSKTEFALATSTAKTLVNNTGNVDSYLSQLQMKFGSKISVQNLEYSKANINHIGSSTVGTGNVIIAPNILEKMASDPQARQHYEKKIQGHFDTIGKANAFMAIHGRRVVSSGVIIHPNGEVTYYSSSDYTPEEKARLERAMKEEDEAKAKKRAEQKRLSEIATDRYLQLVSSTVPEIGLLSSNVFEHYFSTIPSNIDASIFAASTRRPMKFK